MSEQNLQAFTNVFKNILTIFWGRNLFYQALACLVTTLIVTSQLDWNYFLWIRELGAAHFFTPAIFIGMIVPIIGLPLLYIHGKTTGNKKLLRTTWALVQAATLGWLLSSLYKAFTGRVQPPRIVDPLIDASHNWNFGFLEHGIFWGWPSSHTTVAFAMATALITLYPKKKGLVVLCLLYAFYIGIGVSTRIHWFSEFAAGAIFGAVVGKTVGNSFQKKKD